MKASMTSLQVVAIDASAWLGHGISKLIVLLARLFFELLNRAMLGNLPPFVGVAAVVERDGKILMIARHDGLGLGLPGGIVKWNETVEDALLREVREETGYEIVLTGLVGVYSGPSRDPRFSSVEIAYSGSIVNGYGRSSSEGRLAWVSKAGLPGELAFDHKEVLADYFEGKVRAGRDT